MTNEMTVDEMVKRLTIMSADTTIKYNFSLYVALIDHLTAPANHAGLVEHGTETGRPVSHRTPGLAQSPAEVRDGDAAGVAVGSLPSRRLEESPDDPSLLPAARSRGPTRDPGASEADRVNAGRNRQ